MLRPVRTRIALVAAVVVAVVLGGVAMALVVNQRNQLTAALDDNLEQRLDELAAAVRSGAVDPTSFAGGGEQDRLVQLVDASGRVVAATDNVAGLPPVVPPPGSGQVFTTVEGLPIEDDTYRVLARRIDTARGPEVLIVAENTDDLDDSVRLLGASLAVTVPATVLVLVATVWWLVGRTLRPVEAIRRQTADIGSRDLDHRVPEPGTGDEVDRLARTMNAMLDRLEAGAARERRFVADTSHELRTPLTRMRTTLEVAEEADREVRASVLEDVTSLQRLVDDLLVLARADAGVLVGEREPVDLDDIVGAEARRLRADGGVVVDTGGVGAAQVVGDEGGLTRLVRNLVDNAARHASSTVTLTCRETGGPALLVVDDDGPGIAPDDRGRVFERFARLDEARGAETGGTGLGLAIVAEITAAHGGTVEVGESPTGGARFVVRLPAP